MSEEQSYHKHVTKDLSYYKELFSLSSIESSTDGHDLNKWPVIDGLVRNLGSELASLMGMTVDDFFNTQYEENFNDIFEQKIKELSFLTPRRQSNNMGTKEISAEKKLDDVFLSMWQWRERPEDKRKMNRYQKRLLKTKGMNSHKHEIISAEKEQIFSVLDETIKEVNRRFIEKYKDEDRIRKKDCRIYHPCTFNRKIKKLDLGGQGGRKLVTDMPYKDCIITNSGEVLPSSQKSPDAGRITIMLPIQAPFIHRKPRKPKKKEHKEEEEEEVEQTEEQLNEIGKGIFLNTLINDISNISGISMKSITMHNCTNIDIREAHCFQGKVISPVKENEYFHKENKGSSSNKISVDDSKVQSKIDFFLQIMKRQFENKNFRKKSYDLKVYDYFQLLKQIKNIKKITSEIAPKTLNTSSSEEVELIYCSSEHKRFAVTLSFHSSNENDCRSAISNISDFVACTSNEEKYLVASHAIASYEIKCGQKKHFLDWESYWSMFIHPCYFGYKADKENVGIAPMKKKPMFFSDFEVKEASVKQGSNDGMTAPKPKSALLQEINGVKEQRNFRFLKNNKFSKPVKHLRNSIIGKKEDKTVSESANANRAISVFKNDSKCTMKKLDVDEELQIVGWIKQELGIYDFNEMQTQQKSNDIRTSKHEWHTMNNKMTKQLKIDEMKKQYQILKEKINLMVFEERDNYEDGMLLEDILFLITLNDTESKNIYQHLDWSKSILNDSELKKLFLQQPLLEYNRISKKEFCEFFMSLLAVLPQYYLEKKKNKSNITMGVTKINDNDTLAKTRATHDDKLDANQEKYEKINRISSNQEKSLEEKEEKQHFEKVTEINGEPISSLHKSESHPACSYPFQPFMDIVEACQKHCRRLKRIVWQRTLKQSGYSILGEVTDSSSSKHYVLKILPCNNEDDLIILVQEGKAISCLRHPCLMRIHNVESAIVKNCFIRGVKADLYIAFYYIEYYEKGKVVDIYYTDDQQWNQNISNASTILLKWFSQILRGLIELHENGLHHGNLCPGCFYLDKNDSIKIGGFNFCKEQPLLLQEQIIEEHDGAHIFEDKSNIQHTYGRKCYHLPPPELQLSGEKERFQHYLMNDKIDVWDFGCCVYYFVTGVVSHSNSVRQMKDLSNNAFLQSKLFQNNDGHKIIEVMNMCFEKDPKKRAGTKDLLMHISKHITT